MAEFMKAYDRVMGHEGGYANVSSDRGGETYAGVSRKYHPHWHGWAIVDAKKPLKRGAIINDPLLRGHVRTFYKKEFWDKMSGDKIDSQNIADFVFDWFVNSGKIGLKKVQSFLGLIDDGVYGPKTLGEINKKNEDIFIKNLVTIRIKFVENIVDGDEGQRANLKGWKTRINSFLRNPYK